MIVVPIVAAHGLIMPKTSSRAITSPAEHGSTMEVPARVDLTIEEMKEVVRECNACLVWGGHVNLSPADDILIGVERPLNLDTRERDGRFHHVEEEIGGFDAFGDRFAARADGKGARCHGGDAPAQAL